MNMLMYLAQVAACTGIFYLFYHLILARFTFFTLNRWYLISTLLISFLIPLITIPANAPLAATPVKAVALSAIQHIYTAPAPGMQSSVPVVSSIQWDEIIFSVYFIGAGIFCALLFISFRLFYKRIQAPQLIQAGNIKILKGSGKQRNGSFLNYVFINEEGLTEAEIDQIIQHELVHAQQLHSIDNLLARVARAILWFNPFSYAYMQAISANHEYEVDQKVAESNDKALYASLILRLATNTGDGLLNSYFSMYPLRKRITMIFNAPTRKIKKVLYLFVLPLLIISLCCFANREFIEQQVLKPAKTILDPVSGTKQYSTGSLPMQAVELLVNQKDKSTDTAGKDLLKSIRSSEGESNHLQETVLPGQAEEKTTLPKRLSVVNLPDGFGMNPMVMIDEKVYPAEILERISKRCIAGTSTFRIDFAVEKYGAQAKEGLVKISTRNGEISYMDEQERNNLMLIKGSAGLLFVRVPFSDSVGLPSGNDYIVVKRKDGSDMMSSSIGHNQKAAFIIEGKVFSEEELQGAKSIVESSGGHGVGGINDFIAYEKQLKGYEVVFFFSDKMTTITRGTAKGE